MGCTALAWGNLVDSYYAANWALVVTCYLGAAGVLAYLLQSRRVFFVLAVGALLGSLMPGVLGGMARSTGGWLHNLTLYRNGVVRSSGVGAVLSLVLYGIALRMQLLSKEKSQYSLRALLWAITVVAAILGAYQLINR